MSSSDVTVWTGQCGVGLDLRKNIHDLDGLYLNPVLPVLGSICQDPGRDVDQRLAMATRLRLATGQS